MDGADTISSKFGSSITWTSRPESSLTFCMIFWVSVCRGIYRGSQRTSIRHFEAGGNVEDLGEPAKKIKKIEGVPINVPPPVFELRDLEPPSLLNSWKN